MAIILPRMLGVFVLCTIGEYYTEIRSRQSSGLPALLPPLRRVSARCKAHEKHRESQPLDPAICVTMVQEICRSRRLGLANL